MKAQDVMSSEVVSVRPDMPAGEIARLMRDRRLDAVPVVGDGGTLVGLIGRNDLLGRAPDRDWRLTLLSADESEAAGILETLARLRAEERCASDIMSPPVATVRPEADIAEVAGVMARRGVDQVPVVRDGRVLGLVGRADLLRALAPDEAAQGERAEPGLLERVFMGLDEHFQRRDRPEDPPSADRPAAVPEDGASAQGFQQLVRAFRRRTVERHQQAAERRQRKSAELADRQISDEDWRELVHRARHAAEEGRVEALLLRFPSQLCSDGGRAVNVPEPDWPATLRGEAADIYRRFEAELKPQGFELIARVVDYTDGMPGDIGLFLVWGEATE